MNSILIIIALLFGTIITMITILKVIEWLGEM